MVKYGISMEIAGNFAMWARPDTGSTPTSYPVPTWSAAKGIMESVAFLNRGEAWINPKRVEICKRIDSEGGLVHYQPYTNNYRGPLQNNDPGAYQLSSIILSDVCYRIYANIENDTGRPLRRGDNPCHHLQAMFERRLKKGQCHKTPCLGWNEFTASYWGIFRKNDYEVDKAINLELVSILKQVFNRKINGSYQPVFHRGQQAIIKDGGLDYAQ